MTDEKKQQYTLKISQASRTQLVVILYEMTLDYLKEAEDAAGSRDEAAFHTGIKRLIDCYIYEVNSVLKRYKFLMEQAAHLCMLPEEKTTASVLNTEAPAATLIS